MKVPVKYSHSAILVTNIERSASFYERALGWQQTFAGELDEALGQANGFGGAGRMAMGTIDGVHVELVEMRGPLERRAGQRHGGLFMLSVRVPALAPVRAELKAAGIAITRELNVGTIRLIVVTDPDGQELGIIGPRESAS